MKNQEIKKARMSQNIENNEFLQSTEWLKFQEAFGRKTFSVKGENFLAKIIEHILPIVGRYFYVPRGPIVKNPKSEILNPKQIQNFNDQIIKGIQEVFDLAKKENAGWIRIEPKDDKTFEIIRNKIDINRNKIDTFGNKLKIVKAPYDVQPKEVFVIDISKSEEQLLAEMKSKTRYNIKLAQKRGVSIRTTNQYEYTNNKDIKEFLKLTKEMAARQGIVPHPDVYYQKMFETFPAEMLKLYIAEYKGNIISANLVLFYKNTATYLHGASSDTDRNVMAPFLLHWQAMQDAKEKGCKWYDFGGISTNYEYDTNVRNTNKWQGITKFKLGFSTITEPVVFLGTYDIIVNQRRYALYKGLQKAKMIMKKFKR